MNRRAQSVASRGEVMIFLELDGAQEAASADDGERLRRLDNRLARTLSGIGTNLLAHGETVAAERVFGSALDTFLEAGSRRDIAAAESGLGGCLVAAGRFAQAERYLLKSYQVIANEVYFFDTRATLERLVGLYEEWGQAEKAAEYAVALEFLRQQVSEPMGPGEDVAVRPN